MEACLRIVKAKQYDKSLRLFSLCSAVKRKLGSGLGSASKAKPSEGVYVWERWVLPTLTHRGWLWEQIPKADVDT